jgi:hypothetical protein
MATMDSHYLVVLSVVLREVIKGLGEQSDVQKKTCNKAC